MTLRKEINDYVPPSEHLKTAKEIAARFNSKPRNITNQIRNYPDAFLCFKVGKEHLIDIVSYKKWFVEKFKVKG